MLWCSRTPNSPASLELLLIDGYMGTGNCGVVWLVVVSCSQVLTPLGRTQLGREEGGRECWGCQAGSVGWGGERERAYEVGVGPA